MNDIDTSSAPGATASIVQTVLAYAASPWRFAGLIVLLTLSFSGVMVYVEREQIATFVIKNLSKPRLDIENGHKILVKTVRNSSARYGLLWSVDLENNLQVLVDNTNYSGLPLDNVNNGDSAPFLSNGSDVRIAAALMSAQSICFDPSTTHEIPHQRMAERGIKWVCGTPIPSGLGAFIGLMHVLYEQKPDQYVEQAALAALALAASDLTLR